MVKVELVNGTEVMVEEVTETDKGAVMELVVDETRVKEGGTGFAVGGADAEEVILLGTQSPVLADTMVPDKAEPVGKS